MTKLRILVLGSSGMAGHVVTTYLKDNKVFDVIDVGPRKKITDTTRIVDLENPEAITTLLDDTHPDVLVNCTGVLVKASESNKRDATWFNAYLPRLLSELCVYRKIRLIHLSTDCVFSGANGPYCETSAYDGRDFYDRSKALGEVTEGEDLTIRTSIIGPELRSEGTGLFHWFITQKGKVCGFRKAFWSGVTTLELAKFITYLIESESNIKGLIHYSVPGGISKFHLLEEIQKCFRVTTRIEPLDLPVIDKRLICTRTDLGMVPPEYPQQLQELADWIKLHKEFYPHYKEFI